MGQAVDSGVGQISDMPTEGRDVHEKDQNVEEHVLFGAGMFSLLEMSSCYRRITFRLLDCCFRRNRFRIIRSIWWARRYPVSVRTFLT